MKRYIKEKLTPILIGLTAGIILMATINVIDDVIIKIILINQNK